MKTYILQEKVPSRSDFKWTFSCNCEGTEQLQRMKIMIQPTKGHDAEIVDDNVTGKDNMHKNEQPFL
ncbi:MAG: hypothetical protein LUI14_04780 [Lachnospiraceae bacterium]|nr:hypothetical protein [Lachnospiraceae bacterium]